MRRSRSCYALIFGLFLVSCSEGTGPGTPPALDCTDASTRTLAVGAHEIVDPSQAGACLRLPAAGAGGAEHLYVPLATSGQETDDGVSASYRVVGSSPATASGPQLPSPVLSAFRKRLPSQTFHSMLRERERALSANASSSAQFHLGRVAALAAAIPVVGDKDTFNVCSDTLCTDFVSAPATVASVGDRVAIYLDDAVPAGGYDQADLDDVKLLFDDFLYPIDTTAFGVESDINGDGVVIVLLTQRVNALRPECNDDNIVILGYFFGADLLPRSSNNPGSNEAEIFYGLVPGTVQNCTVLKEEATSKLPGTFIHEFQHMISFNQHVLVRGGNSEHTWLNEGLSHFAEELAGRQIPDPECPSFTSCFGQFLQGDVNNAFGYLASPEDFFLIEPGTSSGGLEERGANWLFVRWLADHFASDTIRGTNLTRALVETSDVGAGNVSARTGVDFSTLVGEWQLANYLDDLPGFAAPAGRLRYRTWNFRELAAANSIPFPLDPDSTSGSGYLHNGTLRAGSGRHVQIVQTAGAGSVDMELTTPSGTALSSSIEPRIALVRIR